MSPGPAGCMKEGVFRLDGGFLQDFASSQAGILPSPERDGMIDAKKKSGNNG